MIMIVMVIDHSQVEEMKLDKLEPRGIEVIRLSLELQIMLG